MSCAYAKVSMRRALAAVATPVGAPNHGTCPVADNSSNAAAIGTALRLEPVEMEATAELSKSWTVLGAHRNYFEIVRLSPLNSTTTLSPHDTVTS